MRVLRFWRSSESASTSGFVSVLAPQRVVNLPVLVALIAGGVTLVAG
jgi:hypothetical protein